MSALEEDRGETQEASSDRSMDCPLSSFKLVTAGLKRDSVWRYYDLYTNPDKEYKAHCKCILPNGRRCAKILTGHNASNAKKHLNSCHVEEFKAIQSEEDPKRKKIDPNDQGRLDDHIIRFQKYGQKNPKQQEISMNWAIAFTKNSLAWRLIEDLDFRAALCSMNAQYDPPSAYLLKKEIQMLFDGIKRNIYDSLSDASKISITSDIWTKRGMSASFLGVTGHWYDKKKHSRKTAVLAVRQIEGRHVAELISETVQDILWSWKINSDKISFIVTDNGSNMVKAFQSAQDQLVDQEITRVDETEINIFNEDDEEQGNAYTTDPNLEESFIEMNDEEIDAEIAEFDSEEEQMDEIFATITRLSCFAHRLQCCVRSLDKSTFCNQAREHAFKLISQISRSTVATGLLINESGKKLLSACPTRWSYTLLALERLLELKQSICKITAEINTIDNLRNSDWIAIERYVRFMKPFAEATYALEGQNYTTISEIIPHLMEIKNHLRNMRDMDGFKVASDTMQMELSNRFDQILDTTHPKFQVIFCLATALDPRFSLILHDNQIEAAKQKILVLLGHYGDATTNTVQQQEHNHASNSQPTKLNFVLNMIKSKQLQKQVENVSVSAALREVMLYFSDLSNEPDINIDPVDDFWPKNSGKFPLLAELALDILTIPGTSAPVERVFSQASVVISHRRIRLSGDNLEREVMLKCNRTFL